MKTAQELPLPTFYSIQILLLLKMYIQEYIRIDCELMIEFYNFLLYIYWESTGFLVESCDKHPSRVVGDKLFVI